MRLELLVSVLLLTACSGCGAPTAAPTDEAIGAQVLARFTRNGETVAILATRVAPDSSWLRMYRAAASCAGLVDRPEGITWFLTEQHVVWKDGLNQTGAYDAVARSIFLTRGDTLDVRHESLHDLLWRDRQETGHPAPPFGVCDSHGD